MELSFEAKNQPLQFTKITARERKKERKKDAALFESSHPKVCRSGTTILLSVTCRKTSEVRRVLFLTLIKRVRLNRYDTSLLAS